MSNKVQTLARRLAERFKTTVKRDEDHLLRVGSGIALLISGAAFGAIALVAMVKPAEPTGSGPAVGDASTGSFSPPQFAAIPAGPAGDAIRRGKAIFDDPGTNAAAYVGNAMACKNCHLDSGTRADSSPMWAAWISYPQYRGKTKSINTMQDRIMGCFRYSMNAPNSPSGGPPPAGSDVYRDLEAYFHWLATGAPTGGKLAGGGYPEVQLSSLGYDPKRGAPLYEQKCSGCHGSDGQGAIQPDGVVVYPPLWGSKSYNWGAGMARIDLAARFIKANMPLDQPGTLTDQEAWDIAAYFNSNERPRDPRQTGTIAANAASNFDKQHIYYGKLVNGKLLGAGIPAARK
ncbi:MAG: c-type cytochrome [Pseudomonadota bacterium]